MSSIDVLELICYFQVFYMRGEFSAVDVFRDERIAAITGVLRDLASHLLDSRVAQRDIPVAAFKYLCSRHPKLANYPRILDLQSERASLEKELAELRDEIRTTVAANQSKGVAHSEVTV